MNKVLKTARELGMAEDELSLIISAIYFNQADALRDLLNAGVHGTVSSVDVYGMTPLHHACLCGHAECVELLLQMDADPDVVSSMHDNCSTPLHHAANAKSIACLRLVIEYGANLDVRNWNGETVEDILESKSWLEGILYLRHAIENRQMELEKAKREDLFDFVEKGDFEKAKELLESMEDKADTINRFYRGPHTMLHKASYKGHVDIVKLLLDNGANGRANADNGITPLYAACYVGHLEVVKILVERLPQLLMEPTANDRSVPLHGAVMRGKLEIVKYLLQLRPKIENERTFKEDKSRKNNAQIEKVETPNGSRRSTKGKRPSCTEKTHRNSRLDTATMNVNVQNASGLAPLHFAVMYDKKEIVVELLKCEPIIKGPVENPHPSCLAIDLTTEKEETALFYAILRKNYEMVKLLLNNGADPNHNSVDTNILSPLQISCREKNYEMVKLLLEYKADPNKWSVNSDKLSPLNIACGNNSEDIVKLLLKNGTKDLNEFARKMAEDNGFDTMVAILLNNGVYVESEYKSTETENDSCLHPVIITWSKRKLTAIKERWITDSVLSKNDHESARAVLNENPRLLHGLITRLDLSANQLTSIPVLLFQLPSLRKLNLSENSIRCLPSPESIHENGEDLTWNCPLLEDLELQKNELTNVPKCLFDLPKLKTLLLAKNKIKKMPFNMWKMPCLKELFLQDNDLGNLPVNPKLERERSQFHSMPDPKSRKNVLESTRSEPNAKETDNMKSKRPSWDGESDDSDDEDETKDMSGLQKLDISDNKNITSLPEQLPCLAPNLSKLFAAGCSITSPLYISVLPAGLNILDLSRNKISKFDLTGNEVISVGCCCGLGHARINKSVSSPGLLQGIRSNRKPCIHRSHRSLPLLSSLNLSKNKLEEMLFMINKQKGTSECVISSIHTLNISDNLFKMVPPNIQMMKKLGQLEIIGNTKIDSLPPELGLCTQLYELKFNPQQIRYPPRAIIDKKRENGQIDIQYIRKFLKRVCEQARPYPTIKLMFVGLSRKGKTTLLQQLRKDGTGSYLNQDYQQRFTERMNNERMAQKANHDESTVGVDLCDWTYQRRQFIGNANSREIKFSTWDFAGQQEYYATHTCFLSKRAIYLLVWKLTDGFEGIEQLESWLLNIQARAPDSAVIIVGTHYDELPTQHRKEMVNLYRYEIKKRYMAESLGGKIIKLFEKGLPRVKATVEVSCKNRTEYNIKELRNVIYETAISLKDTRNDSLLEAIVPASYIETEKAVANIAKRLRNEKQYPVLNIKQFRSEVRKQFQENGVRELKDDELDDAVQFLHECGVLLHFDDPSLTNQYFIDPQWLCDMLANVITIRDVNPFKENGVLKVDDLKDQIFRGQRFSSSHVENYIELMNKFEVAIKVADKYLLVPSFLPERQVGYQKVSSRMCPILQKAMNVDTYLKHRVFRRQYLMSYVPSGFWARLITRLIADDRFSKILASCMDLLGIDGEADENKTEYKESLKLTAPPEWGCWKTGVELSCFEVKLMRICQLDQGELFYGHDGRSNDKIFIKNCIHDSSETRTIEILVPSVRLSVGVDCEAEAKAFRLVSVEEDNPQTASELLTLAVEHMDNLLSDWFNALDTYQNIHGDRSIRRIGLCPDCLGERIHKSEHKESTNSGDTQQDIDPSTSSTTDETEAANDDDTDTEQKLKKIADGCINGFEFEEVLKSVDDYKPLVCYSHGENEFKMVFVDVMFEDLPQSYLFTNEQVTRTKFIAAGSYGAVFKGMLTVGDDSRTVAIKVPHNTDACGTTNTLAVRDVIKNKNLKAGAPTVFASGVYKSIRQELSILVPVSHKHILKLIGVAFSPLCLLIEFAPKGSLQNVLSQYKKTGRKLDTYAIQQCVLQVSDALKYLHSRNIIYRDLKSENVLVWSFPDPGSTSETASDIYLKLADYGISRPVAITGLRGLWGTHGFMAPEIIRYKGKETYSKKVDSFSFGSFLYELITRKMPFEDFGDGSIDQLIVDGNRPKISSRDKQIPVPILSLLYKCWEHEAVDRPSQADIYSSAKLKEFPRLLSDLECEDALKLQVAITTNRKGATVIENCADSRDLIGSEMWLCCNEESQDDENKKPVGKITVLNYSDGKCNTLKKIQLVDTVLVACVVGSTVWIGTKKGAILVYCSMTFKPLAMAYPVGSRSILSILHSLACNCVVIGSIDGSIMSYRDNYSSYEYDIPDADVVKYFGKVDYNEPIKEMIHNRVFTDSMTSNPVVCLAAVPSRANHSRMEDTVNFYGSGGEPIVSTSRDHVEWASDDLSAGNSGPFPLRYELWCGLQRGLITILDLEDLEKVNVLSAKESEINNPAIKQLCVTRIETRRMFQSSCHPQCPAEGVTFSESESASVWVVLYPGTCVYRWNVDKRKIEAKFDAALQKPDNDLYSFKSASKQTAVQVSNAQIISMVVVEDYLYLGTTYGCMTVCESMSLTPLSNIRCFTEALDYLVPLQMVLNRGNTGQHKEQLLLASGRNCLDKWNKDKRNRTKVNGNYSTILTWYADQWHT